LLHVVAAGCVGVERTNPVGRVLEAGRLYVCALKYCLLLDSDCVYPKFSSIQHVEPHGIVRGSIDPCAVWVLAQIIGSWLSFRPGAFQKTYRVVAKQQTEMKSNTLEYSL
jgi:hypothetical protein